MFIAAVLVTAPEWKQPKCPSVDERVNETVEQHNGTLFDYKKEPSVGTYYNPGDL